MMFVELVHAKRNFYGLHGVKDIFRGSEQKS